MKRTKFDKNLESDIIEAVQFAFNDKRTNKSRLVDLYEAVFFVKLCDTCQNEQILAYIRLTRFKQNNFEMKKAEVPSEKYTFNPKYADATVSVKSKRWSITAETLTDEQARYILGVGSWDNMELIVTNERAEELKKETAAAKPKAKAKPKAEEAPEEVAKPEPKKRKPKAKK